MSINPKFEGKKVKRIIGRKVVEHVVKDGKLVPVDPAENAIVVAAAERRDEFVTAVQGALLNISEAGEFFKGDDPGRAKADYIVLTLQRKGLI